jgi:hypothetical protein
MFARQVSAFEATPPLLVEDRMAYALGRVGPSITLAALCETFAFGMRVFLDIAQNPFSTRCGICVFGWGKRSYCSPAPRTRLLLDTCVYTHANVSA